MLAGCSGCFLHFAGASAVSALFLFLYPGLMIRPAPSNWFVLYLTRSRLKTMSYWRPWQSTNRCIMPVFRRSFIELGFGTHAAHGIRIISSKSRLYSWILLGMGLAAYALAHAPHRLDSLAYLFDLRLRNMAGFSRLEIVFWQIAAYHFQWPRSRPDIFSFCVVRDPLRPRDATVF